MRGIFPLLSLLLILVLVLPSPVLAQDPLTQTYTFSDDSVEFDLPAGWSVLENGGLALISNFNPSSDAGQPAPGEAQALIISPTLIQSQWDMPRYSDLESVAQAGVDALGLGPQVSVGAPLPIPLGANEGVTITMSDTESEGFILSIDIGGGDAAVMIAIGLPNEFTQFVPTLISIAISVRKPGAVVPIPTATSPLIPTPTIKPTTDLGSLGPGNQATPTVVAQAAIPTDRVVPITGDNMATLEELHMWQTPGNVSQMGFHPSVYALAYAGGDTNFRVLGATTGEELLTLFHDAAVTSIAFSSDGNLLAAGSAEGGVRVFDVTADTVTHELRLVGPIVSVSFTPNDQFLIIVDQGGAAVWLYGLGDESQSTIGVNIRGMNAAAYHGDSQILAVGTDTGLLLWNLNSGESFRVEEGMRFTYVSFAPNGSEVAAVNDVGGFRLINPVDGSQLAGLDAVEGQFYTAVVYNPGSNLAVVGMENGNLFIVDFVDENDAAFIFPEASMAVTDITFSAGGTLMAVAFGDPLNPAAPGEIRLYGVLQ